MQSILQGPCTSLQAVLRGDAVLSGGEGVGTGTVLGIILALANDFPSSLSWTPL